MPVSSSKHTLSADNRLNLPNKIYWLYLNFINNSNPNKDTDPELEIDTFRTNDLSFKYEGFLGTVSPARYLCNLFWKEFLHEYSTELGGTIKALEIGCGSGVYGQLMHQILPNSFEYTGLDIVESEHWKKYSNNDKFNFYTADSADMRDHLKNVNLILTQSALEHFEEDLTFFNQLAEYVLERDQPLIQVHLIPSSACITTFPWHGIRQYTPNTLSKLTRLFPTGTTKTLYKLGAAKCNKTHRKWITIPSLLRRPNRRKSHLHEYQDELLKAIETDMSSSSDEACFYALVLKHPSSPITSDQA